MTFLEIAKPLAAMNIPITPVRPGTKRAFLPDFPTTATTDLKQIEAWDRLYSDHNAACVARAEEGGVWMWEVDSPDVGARLKKDTGHDISELSDTFRVRSRPGRGHFYFVHDAVSMTLGNISQSYVQGQDWSVRTDREYVVAPGSRLPDRPEPYTALNNNKPVVAPKWLIDWLLSQKIQKNANTTSAPDATRNERGLVPRGAIHGFMLTQAGRMRNAGLNEDEIEPALLRIVHEQCEGPIDDEKVRTMAKSITNFPEGSSGYTLEMPKTDAAPAAAPIEITPEMLAKEFPNYDGSVPLELPMLIQGFMPKGAGFFGSPAGTVKTWLGLSCTKALTTATPLWGTYPVKEKVAVLYLVPEASDASFKLRLNKMGITQDPTLFRYRTITQGKTRPLTDPLVLAMVKELQMGGRQVLVVVDTAVRFFSGKDENSSMDNSLVEDSDVLRGLGADILFLHHSPKSMKDAPEMTTENVLRGTGDFGAMADYVYGFRRDESKYMNGEGAEEVEAVCTKPRDINPPPLPFRLQLKRAPQKGESSPVSVIDETGDLRYIPNVLLKDEQRVHFLAAVKADSYVSLKSLTELLKLRKDGVKALAKAIGWRQVKHITKNAEGKEVSRFRWTNVIPMDNQAPWADEGKPAA